MEIYIQTIYVIYNFSERLLAFKLRYVKSVKRYLCIWHCTVHTYSFISIKQGLLLSEVFPPLDTAKRLLPVKHTHTYVSVLITDILYTDLAVFCIQVGYNNAVYIKGSTVYSLNEYWSQWNPFGKSVSECYAVTKWTWQRGENFYGFFNVCFN